MRSEQLDVRTPSLPSLEMLFIIALHQAPRHPRVPAQQQMGDDLC